MKNIKTEIFTDIKFDHWIGKACPEKIKPFFYLARLDRPIGVWLLLLPALWAIVLASGGIVRMNAQDWVLVLLFILGAITMRSAGCVINDLWDKDLDKKVARTQLRPLASGVISKPKAYVFLFGLLALGFYILTQLSFVTILLGILSVPLIIIYPLMKRITWWPQGFLGLVFNFGALMGWSAVTGIVEIPALLLYVAGALWTLAYDTIYAYQDIEDDALIGIKSSARKLGTKGKKWVQKFYYASWGITAIAFTLESQSFLAPIFLIPALLFIRKRMKTWYVTKPESALEMFKANKEYGLLILAALCVSHLPF